MHKIKVENLYPVRLFRALLLSTLLVVQFFSVAVVSYTITPTTVEAATIDCKKEPQSPKIGSPQSQSAYNDYTAAHQAWVNKCQKASPPSTTNPPICYALDPNGGGAYKKKDDCTGVDTSPAAGGALQNGKCYVIGGTLSGQNKTIVPAYPIPCPANAVQTPFSPPLCKQISYKNVPIAPGADVPGSIQVKDSNGNIDPNQRQTLEAVEVDCPAGAKDQNGQPLATGKCYLKIVPGEGQNVGNKYDNYIEDPGCSKNYDRYKSDISNVTQTLATGSDNKSGCDVKWNNPLTWILCPVADLVLNAVQKLKDGIKDNLSYQIPDDQGFFTVWTNLRNIANVMFVVALLIIILSTTLAGRL